ncbi:type B chloramphenicol O-acetyltransferase [Legionella saoudiensis]|uniref:type B chloramphenicol O-acetyltransferase n=1 Tax=Legionella saoudiensis TaxID=1750561 RepID=UPI000731D866|nr:type B chloramphenicol O-acetyltransferase [Legionella saoudiensis]
MSSNNYFESPFKGVPLDQQVTNPNIIVGRYSYYSGYYHGHSFDDCARYLLPDQNVDKLIIGSFCSIGTGVSFMMAGNQGHRMDWISTFPFFYTGEPEFAEALDGYQPAGDTIIGHDVWIGAEAMIMPGITIGSGSVIGSRSVVTKDVEPYSIVTGVPAKVIRRRFSENEIAQLEEMAWWDWPVERLSQAQTILCSNNIQKLYDYWLSWKF